MMPIEDLSEDELSELMSIAESQIIAATGLNIKPRNYKMIEEYNGTDTTILLDFFPVLSVDSFTIADTEINHDDYVLDAECGVVYLKNIYDTGFMDISYNVGFTDEQYQALIEPLVNLMVEYACDTGWDKDASSIHEGDVSISYDTSLGKGALIQQGLDNLRAMFNVQARLI